MIYDKKMTLSQRNRYFKAGMALSFLCFLGISSQAAKLLPLYPALTSQALKRAPGLFQEIAARFLQAAPYTPFAAAAASALYALAASILIYFFFEKTHAPEILFLGLFSASFVFETLRLMLPLRLLYDFPGFFLIIGTRILMFGRFFAVLSFFAASIYAAGFELQKQGLVVFAIAIGALIVSLGIPVDGLAWDTNLVMISGYTRVFRLAEAAILAIAALSFFVASWTRGSREYLAIALGALLITAGRNLLINADTWVSLAPGFVMLCAGSWIVLEKLHQVYLWL